MKKIIAMAALISVLMTGCSKQQPDETTINSVTESATETTAETSAETENVTTIVTEPVTEAETTAVTEQEQEKELFRMVYTGDCWRTFNLGNGIICVQSEQLYFVNVYTGEVENSVSVPDDFSRPIDRIVRGNGDVLAKVVCSEYDYSVTPPTYSADVLIVKDDYTCEAIYDGNPAAASFEACGHNITEWGFLDIVDTDSGEVIIPGYTQEGDEYGFYTKRNWYGFDIDENRFVYSIGGYESIPGFGIYDFSTGTATTVPESRDLIPKGYHNGKIYSVKSSWDGFGTELYVTDAETLETEFFMDIPFELNSAYDYIEYHMPENGEYILLYKRAYTTENDVTLPAQVYKINPDTAEVEDMYELPKEYRFTENGLMVDNDTFACVSGGLLLIDIE